MKKALVLGLLLGGFAPLSAVGSDTLVKFRGGIGVDPVSNVADNGTVTHNAVRGISPPGQIWRIADLKADVRLEGRIRVHGRGLLLAGGNNIGTNAGQTVFATLFCGPAASAGAHSSSPAGVALEANGDFRIDDHLSPPPPDPCDNPVLLIRSVGGAWFAAGIPELDERDQPGRAWTLKPGEQRVPEAPRGSALTDEHGQPFEELEEPGG